MKRMPSGHAVSRRWAVIRDAIRTQLWPLPTIAILIAVVAGVAVPRLDAGLDEGGLAPHVAYLFDGGPEAARSVLAAIAGSLVTVTALTFSLTLITLQLASSQFSPRLLRTFTTDRVVQGTLALLLATFVYALTVLRSVRSGTATQGDVVPQLSVTMAYLLTVASVLALVGFLAHLVREIRVDTMLRNVHREASLTLAAALPDGDHVDPTPTAFTPPATAAHLVAGRSGFLTSVNESALLDAARRFDVCLAIDRAPGDSLVAGTPVGRAWAADGTGGVPAESFPQLHSDVAEALTIGFERTSAQDLGFGLRQLTDVAVKSLSPGINDPTTAVHALGHSSALLCELAAADPGPRQLRDDEGRVRVLVDAPTLADLLDLAVSQPRRYGASDPAVLVRLHTLLAELAWSSPRPDHRHAVADQLMRLRGTVGEQHFDEAELAGLARAEALVEGALQGRWAS